MAVPSADAAARSRRGGSGFAPTTEPSAGLVAGLSVAAIITAGLVSPERAEHGPVLCPFRLVTGLPCPGCGLTRSWVDLMHGQWAAGMAANPFGVVALGVAATIVVVTASRVVRRRPLPSYGEIFGSAGSAGSAGLRHRALLLVLAAWVGFGLVRCLVVALG